MVRKMRVEASRKKTREGEVKKVRSVLFYEREKKEEETVKKRKKKMKLGKQSVDPSRRPRQALGKHDVDQFDPKHVEQSTSEEGSNKNCKQQILKGEIIPNEGTGHCKEPANEEGNYVVMSNDYDVMSDKARTITGNNYKSQGVILGK